MNSISIKGLSEILKVDYADSRGMIKVLEKLGFAKEVEKKKDNGVKGKPTTFYEISPNFLSLLTNNKEHIVGNVIENCPFVTNTKEQCNLPKEVPADLSSNIEF